MYNSNNQIKLAYLSAFLHASLIGFSFIFVKLALTVSNPLDTLSHRFTVSIVAASIPVLCGWIRLNIKFKHLLAILPLALFYPTLFFAFQAFGLVHTSTSEAGIIQATVPIFTIIFASLLLKEHSSTCQKISLFISVLGVIYIFYMKSKGIDLEATSMKGSILILLSTLSISGYIILTRKLTQKIRLVDLTYIMAAIGFLFFNGMSIIQHSTEGTLVHYFDAFTSPVFIVSILYLGLISSLVTSFLSNFALSRINASKMSVFNNLSTLVTLIGGSIFLKEKLEYFHLIGAVMIILGVLGTNFLVSTQKSR